MKIMVASDIHGSEYYCRKMLKAYEHEDADKLLLLGDILYHGPRNDLPKDYNPKSVAAMLNDISDDILCVRGNCDSEVDQMMLDFPIMAEYCILYIGGHMVFATHGHKFNEENLPPLKKSDILLNGHTHVARCTEHGAYLYVNPGSVSIPKLDTPHGYIVMSDTSIEFKTLDSVIYNNYKQQ